MAGLLGVGLGAASAQSALPAGNPAPAAVPSGALVLRTIDDPPTGHRWLLMRDESHPGGPGKLVLSAEAPAATVSSGVANAASHSVNGSGTGGLQAPRSAPQPQIRTGDRLLVEEHSRVADVQLAAVALGNAAIGSVFSARLEIGGRVVNLVAQGPGRATFAAGRESQP